MRNKSGLMQRGRNYFTPKNSLKNLVNPAFTFLKNIRFMILTHF